MKPSEVKRAIRQCMAAKRPVYVVGAPGVGKSAVIREVAEEDGIGFIDERMLQRDPVDVRGLPVVVDGATRWTRPDFLPADGQGIMLLDELAAAPTLVQAACYQLIHDRRIGSHPLPDGWTVVAAGNRETDRAVVNRTPSALANRFIWIDFELDLADWVAWALAHDVATEVIAFLRFRPELLSTFDPKHNYKTFASPRTWEILSDVLKAGNGELCLELAKGIVGEGAAIEFVAFLKTYRSLPDPDTVLLNPETAIVPTDPAALYATCGMLARKASQQNFNQLAKYANRLPDEYSALLVRDAERRTPAIAETRGFIEWAAAHDAVMV